MPMAQLLQVAALLASCHAGAHVDWQLRGRNQVRVGLINTPGAAQANTISFTETGMPSGQMHATFAHGQDLTLRYQPRLFDVLRYSPPIGSVPATTLWTGLSVLHRVTLNYKAGEEHLVAFTGQLNLSLGKIDTGDPSTQTLESGLLPGQLGTLFNQTNLNAILTFKHRPHRNVRLMTQETLGLIQYQANQAQGYFANMPQLQSAKGGSNQTQLRLFVRSEFEYLLGPKSSLFADVDLTDVSYQDTASFPAFAPSVGFGTSWAGPGKLKVQAGFIKYWVNPLPGIYEKPSYLPTANLTVSQTFAAIGLPKLTANGVLSVIPYYNLQFSSLEPRSTIMAQLNYAFNRQWSVLGNFRLLSSRYYNFKRWNTLQRGHPRNIMLGSIGVRYNWRDILGFDLTAYGSNQTYQKSSTMSYSQMRQAYVMFGLQGTWQTR